MKQRITVCLPALCLALTACATIPTSPSVLVLPGTGKTFDQFRANDVECRQFAYHQVGGVTAGQAARDAALRSATVGTVVGAATGAAISGGRGAAVGAGVGLAGGTLAGTGAATTAQSDSQTRYDYAYIQCMYANGHRVPVPGRLVDEVRQDTYPPPPAGSPPPAPPEVRPR